MEIAPVKFVLRKGNFFFISDSGSEHRLTMAIIIANGLQDLCIVKEDGKISFSKISKTKPEDIFILPKGDILWLTLDPPFNGNKAICQDIGEDPENIRPFIKALMEHGGFMLQGKDYDMYAGGRY